MQCSHRNRIAKSVEEKLHDCRLKAETLAHEISLQEEKQISKTLEQPKQLGITLDATLVTSKRASVTFLPCRPISSN